jgi:death-on-curing protein
MDEPAFLSVDDVLLFHHEQIERYGGLPGVGDPQLLRSAIAQAQATYERRFLHGDNFAMAAVYFFHIVQNHRLIEPLVRERP